MRTVFCIKPIVLSAIAVALAGCGGGGSDSFTIYGTRGGASALSLDMSNEPAKAKLTAAGLNVKESTCYARVPNTSTATTCIHDGSWQNTSRIDGFKVEGGESSGTGAGFKLLTEDVLVGWVPAKCDLSEGA